MNSIKLFAAASVVALFCTVPAFAQDNNRITVNLDVADSQMDSETMKQILDRDVERVKRIQERTKDVQLKPAAKPETAEKDEPKAEEQTEHKLPVITTDQLRRIVERDRARAKWMGERIRAGQIEYEAEQYIKDHPGEFTPGKTLPGWTDNFTAAVGKAKAEKKPILALFTGSDWCGPCQSLEKNILIQPAFKDFAKQHLVTLFLDFPRDTKLDDGVKKQNDDLAKTFSVEAYPTILVLSSDGEKELWKQVGYTALFLEKLQEALMGLDKDFPATAKALKDAKEAEAKAKAEKEKAELEEFEKQQQKEEEAARRNAELHPLGAGRIFQANYHPEWADDPEMQKLKQDLDKNDPSKGPDVLPVKLD